MNTFCAHCNHSAKVRLNAQGAKCIVEVDYRVFFNRLLLRYHVRRLKLDVGFEVKTSNV